MKKLFIVLSCLSGIVYADTNDNNYSINWNLVFNQNSNNSSNESVQKFLIKSLSESTNFNTPHIITGFAPIKYQAESGSKVLGIEQSSTLTKIQLKKSVTQNIPLLFDYSNGNEHVVNYRIFNETNSITYIMDYKPRIIELAYPDYDPNKIKKYKVTLENNEKILFFTGSLFYIDNFKLDKEQFTATTSKTIMDSTNLTKYLPVGANLSGTCIKGQAVLKSVSVNGINLLKTPVDVGFTNEKNFNMLCNSGNPKNLLLFSDLILEEKSK